MNHRLRLVCFALVAAAISVAAVSKPVKRLTLRRVNEVNALSTAQKPARVKVAISGYDPVSIVPDGKRNVIENIREFRFPTQFDPPVASDTVPAIPTTPRAFETINSGWTITLTTRARGELIEIYGQADYSDVQLTNGGYGALAGPIFADDGPIITPNSVRLPKSQTTTTRFHLFAVPGETYEVPFYRGAKEEKHTVTVTKE